MEAEDKKLQPVKVRIIEVEWLNKNLKRFFEYLSDKSDESIFSNELVKVLLVEQNYSVQLVFKVLLPYCVYMVSVLLYFNFVLTESELTRDRAFFEGSIQRVTLRSLILVFSLLFIGVEVVQMFSLK